jgi:hypothetical protein
MKTTVKTIIIFTLVNILFGLNSFGQPPANYEAKKSGTWNDYRVWSRNGALQNNIGYSFSGNVTITIPKDYTITIGTNETVLFSSPNVTFNILGTLIVNGKIVFDKPNTRLTVNGNMIVNGTVDVDGKGSSSLAGTGTITIADGAAFDWNGSPLNLDEHRNFKGSIIEPVEDITIPSPEIQSVFRDEHNHRVFYIDWEFDTTQNYTIGGQDYTFAGFRIVRRFKGYEHPESIIKGYFSYDENDLFLGFDNSLVVKEYDDVIRDEEVAGFPKDLTPEYYISAAYKKVMGLKSDSEDNYIFSAESVVAEANQPLPVSLLFFSAKTLQNSVQLQWATAAEINNDFFTIERSMDGHNWEAISYIHGAGNANYVINYEFVDQFPVSGISYYRLKQTDFDGKFEYFAPVAVQTHGINAASEIVNVAISQTKMDISIMNENETAMLVVADIRGRIISQQNIMADNFVQNITVDFQRNYTGEVVMVRLVSSDKSDEKKFMVR